VFVNSPTTTLNTRRSLPVALRLTLLATAVLAIALLIGGTLFSRALKTSSNRQLELSARERVASLVRLVESDTVPKRLPAPRDSPLFAQVIGPDQHVAGATSNVSDMEAMVVSPARQTINESLEVGKAIIDKAECRYFREMATNSKGTYEVIVAAPMRVSNQLQTTFQSQLIAIGPLLLGAAALALYFLARRALAPVDRMRADVESISATDLTKRVRTPGANDEVGRLAHTMNALLGRLQSASEKQARFVSDASHELRTPLATSRTRLEVALHRETAADWPTVGRNLLKDNLRMGRLVDELLILATSDGSTPKPFREVDLDEILQDVVASIRLTSPIPISTANVSAGRIMGDPDQLTRVFTNLLDNAVRYATSTVSFSLQHANDATGNGTVVVRVIDDGPGVDPAERERIFERFTRSDESRTRADGGAGLGLSIVREIVRAHNGTVTVEDSPNPGTVVVVRFPAVS
jgi:signal transduction histidine kinase